MRRSKESVMEALRSRDMLLASVTKAQDDLDKTINLLGERLEDWYGIYFPELRAEDKLKYAEASLVIDRDNFDETALLAFFGQKTVSDLSEASKKSLGAKISPKDLEQCKSLAKTVVSLNTLRQEYGDYQRALANELCPNLTAVGGPEIASKLVSHVGSLHKLAILAASAIQVLGAEKALFKHLKNRNVPPPKHGIIFQHPKISSSPRLVRGKIARALANKLCLAAKADAFTKHDISEQLKADFEKRFAQIMKEYESAKTKMPGKQSEPERQEQ
jgi:nucleolar protein 56